MFLMRVLNWQKVRGLGELQILTRSSYLMIVFVPILVALWPAVRYSVSRYNYAVTDTRDALESAAVKLEHQIERAGSVLSTIQPSTQDTGESETGFVTRANAILESVRQRADEIAQEYSPKTVRNPLLPGAWARTFFAALAVLLGHLLYQMFAPDTIRRQGAQEFASVRKNDYASNPTDGTLRRADYYLHREPYRRSGMSIEELQNFPPEERQRRAIDMVEQGAFAEYRYLSIRAPIAIILSAALYIVGLSFVVHILWQQSINVARAAGWM